MFSTRTAIPMLVPRLICFVMRKPIAFVPPVPLAKLSWHGAADHYRVGGELADQVEDFHRYVWRETSELAIQGSS
jgi:hypothetical protein